MNLVEAEEVGPVEGDAPLVTPPRPPHRRVSVSLLFTLTVLIGTVVAIYLVFPARHDVLVSDAIALHEEPGEWDLESPTVGELKAWAMGITGKEIVLPAAPTAIRGARRVEIFERGAAVMRFAIGSDDVTYLCQRARGIAPKTQRRVEGDIVAVGRLQGRITCVLVGPVASEATWSAAFPR